MDLLIGFIIGLVVGVVLAKKGHYIWDLLNPSKGDKIH